MVRWVATNTDVTDLPRGSGTPSASGQPARSAHDAIRVWKIGGAITYWNRGAERLYGWSGSEAIGNISHDLLQTRAALSLHDIEAEIAEKDQWCGEQSHTERDGREIIVESRHVRVRYGDEELALETNRNVTDRIKAGRSQRESEEGFRGIFEHAATGIAITDLTGWFQSCNPAYSALLDQPAFRRNRLKAEKLIDS